jgi:hypothetical protein
MMARLKTQCLAFSPGQHTGDLLMSWWFSRESARLGQGAPIAVEQADTSALAARYKNESSGLFGRRSMGVR